MRRATILALLLGAGSLVADLPVLPAPAACAKDDKDDKAKERERVKRENSLKKFASEFGAKDVSALLGHVPPGQKLSLALGGDLASGDYAAEQARGVLEQYFAGVESLSVDTTNDGKDGYVVKGLVGRFPVTFRKKGENKKQTVTLHVTLGALDATERYTLAKLSIV